MRAYPPHILDNHNPYESFFAIPGPGPLTYIREGAAAGIVAGGAAGLALGTHLAGLLVWVGGGLLLFRYLETLRYLLATLQSLWRSCGGCLMHCARRGEIDKDIYWVYYTWQRNPMRWVGACPEPAGLCTHAESARSCPGAGGRRIPCCFVQLPVRSAVPPPFCSCSPCWPASA